jgi:hypothetical protein
MICGTVACNPNVGIASPGIARELTGANQALLNRVGYSRNYAIEGESLARSLPAAIHDAVSMAADVRQMRAARKRK